MPIYEFYCNGCMTAFEKLCRMGCDKIPCPHCNSNDVSKRVSRTSMSISGRSSKSSGSGSGSGCGSSCSTKHCGSCSC